MLITVQRTVPAREMQNHPSEPFALLCPAICPEDIWHSDPLCSYERLWPTKIGAVVLIHYALLRGGGGEGEESTQWELLSIQANVLNSSNFCTLFSCVSAKISISSHTDM